MGGVSSCMANDSFGREVRSKHTQEQPHAVGWELGLLQALETIKDWRGGLLMWDYTLSKWNEAPGTADCIQIKHQACTTVLPSHVLQSTALPEHTGQETVSFFFCCC